MAVSNDHTPPPLARDSALFLDFDGTLVDIAPTPEEVVLEAGLREALAALSAAHDGALALVSGRPIAALDAHLAPLVTAAAGVHGLELRFPDGHCESLEASADLTQIKTAMEHLVAANPGLRLEEKRGALGLHTRARPELEAACRARIAPLVAAEPGLTLLEGLCILEVKTASVNKGTALRRFMEDPPFRGRRPVFAGDDVTDEDAIRATQDLGGIAVKIGDQPSAARYRLPSAQAFRHWLLQQALGAL
ncbi:MAG: trehalose-phosphatase [Rhodospirillales bacterium]